MQPRNIFLVVILRLPLYTDHSKTSCHFFFTSCYFISLPFHLGQQLQVILGRGEDAPRARNILAWCKFLDGDHGAAAGEFCASMSAADDPEFLEEVWVGTREMRETGRLRYRDMK